MKSKPSRLTVWGMALVCTIALGACNDSSIRLQFVTVAPISGEIYVSGSVAGAFAVPHAQFFNMEEQLAGGLRRSLLP